jgi:hypothetical protein
MHRTFAAAHNNPGDDEETQKDEPDEKIVPLFLNQTIQELGHTRNVRNRVFHTILRGLFDSLQQLGNQRSKFHARRSLRVICTQETHFATSLHDNKSHERPTLFPAWTRFGKVQTGSGGRLCCDSLPFGLLLALHTGNRAPRRAADLGDDALLLVFRQVLHKKVISPFQFGIAIDLF